MKSCADGWYILVFDSFNVCYIVTTPRFMTSSKWRRRRGTPAKRIHHDVTILHGLLKLVVLAIHSVINYQHTRL